MGKIETLSIDIESYSDVDLQKSGVYKYAQSPNFEILLFGMSVNGGEVVVYDLAQGEKLPMDIITALTDDTVTKWAFNAAFERVCLSVWLQRNYALQNEKEEAIANNVNYNAGKERTHEIIEYLNSQPKRVTAYDEQLVRKLIEKITVFDDHLDFLFKSGIQIEIKG